MERLDLMRGDMVDRRYRVSNSLGEGSFGQVFRVETPDGQSVALKILKMWCISTDEREKVRQRFDMEYETGRIDSPYLVHSLNKGIYHGNPYIVMEYCSGGDLMHAINRGKVDIARVGTEVLHGLEALHREGKVHRDLKPENVLFRKNGTAVLTDFGISGDRNNRLTRRGILGTPKEIMGTFIYMPPEQIRPPTGNATVLPTTDIFSFGVMLYQMLSGELPFGKLHTDDDMERYCENSRTGRWNRRPIEHLKTAKTWMPIVEGCLQPNYKKRLQTVAEVLSLMPAVADMPSIEQQPSRRQGRVWQMRIMQGEEAGHVYTLDPRRCHNSVLHMGRQDDSVHNDLPIVETQSRYISRAHCTLEWDAAEHRWYLWDGQWTSAGWRPSLNGTFVGSKQATTDDAIPLSDSDIVSLGDVTLRVEAVI